MAESPGERFWKNRARIVCLKHNAATWLAGWLPFCLVSSVAALCAILLLRRQGADLGIVWAGLAALLAAGAGIIGWLRRKMFFQIPDGLVRLDAALGLHNRLTAAAAGVGRWPEPIMAAGDRWHFRWRRIVFQFAGTGALVCLAALVPLPDQVLSPASPNIPPSAWTDVETWIDTLQKENLVQPDSLENLRDQLDALRHQDPESWYDHASLEAGDSLHAETSRALHDLQKNLQSAADQTSKLLASSDQGMSDRELQALGRELADALPGMASGRLPLNPELLKKLQQMDPKSLKSLSQEQLAQLQKQLQQGSAACKKCLGDGEESGIMKIRLSAPGEGSRTGKGGPGGGGGPADLTAKDATDLHSTATDTVNNDDISRALPAEIVALSAGEHRVDQNPDSKPSGGQIAAPGQGGEAVWKDSLTPHERETIAKFFE